MSDANGISVSCRLARADFRFDAAFEAGPGVTALFGPSGSGKTTAIRLIAGLERPDDGRITIGDTVLLDTRRGIVVPPHRRRIGLVFQDACLLPHLSVRTNLTYGRWFTPRRERHIGFGPVVDMLGIGHLLDRRPGTLSGGERQRVAIGRALLTSPRLLLMDEPLASLDQARKQDILPFIERLVATFGIPVIYVSHAVEEVTRLATRVVRLEAGRVVMQGTPAEAFGPAQGATGDRFAARSVITATVRRRLPDYGLTLLAHPAGEIVVPGLIDREGEVRVAIRATDVTLARHRPEGVSTRTVLAGRILTVDAHGADPFAQVTVGLAGGDEVSAAVTRLALDTLALRVGEEIFLLMKASAVDESGLPGAKRPAFHSA